MTEASTDADRPERHAALLAWTAGCLGVDQVELRPVLGGAANSGFEVHAGTPAAGPIGFLRTKSDAPFRCLPYTLRREGDILAAARRIGLPVAPVLGARSDPDALLLGFVAGVSRPGPQEIERVAPKYLALIAALHATDPTEFPVEQFPTMRAAVEADLAAWTREASHHGVLDEPLVALGARVLAERMPHLYGAASLVHGDAGAGNFLADDGEVTAILDWELAHAGDPHEDLAWLWMRGAHSSFGDPAIRIGEYERAAQRRLDPTRLDWHLAFVMWKTAVSLHGRLSTPVLGDLGMVAMVVALAYDVLLAGELVGMLGGTSDDPSPAEPVREASWGVVLADELLASAGLPDEQAIVIAYLRESLALGAWQRRALDDDCAERLGIRADALTAHVRTCPPDGLLALAEVLARATERAALASPKSVRRIERAWTIGLGVRRTRGARRDG